MVLFKFYTNLYYTALPKFTFHYGPIQMESKVVNKTYTLGFTFHYGPIQIKND